MVRALASNLYWPEGTSDFLRRSRFAKRTQTVESGGVEEAGAASYLGLLVSLPGSLGGFPRTSSKATKQHLAIVVALGLLASLGPALQLGKKDRQHLQNLEHL